MGVVYMDGDLVGEVVKGMIYLKVVIDYILERCAYEEILLAQAEQLAFGVVVGRVEHLGNGFGKGVFLDSFDILSLRKSFHVEIAAVTRSPETENGYGAAVGSRNEHIIRDGFDFVVVHMVNFKVVVVPHLLNSAAEADVYCLVLTGDEPCFAGRQPDVGKLKLFAVNYTLFEQPVFVADLKGARGIIH